MKRKPTGYPGDLGTPIPFPSESRGTFDTHHQRLDVEFKKRVLLLFDYYKIPIGQLGVNKWMELALELAMEHVPGLTIADPPKRQKNATSIPSESTRSTRGRPEIFSKEDIEFIEQGLPELQAGLKARGRRGSKLAAIKLILEAKASGEGRHSTAFNRSAKTVLNRIKPSRK